MGIVDWGLPAIVSMSWQSQEFELPKGEASTKTKKKKKSESAPPSLVATGRYWCRFAHIASTETAFPEKYLVAGAGPFCRQARPQWGTPPLFQRR